MATYATPNLDPTKMIKSSGLYDAAAAGGMSYEDWAKANPSGDMPSIAPKQIDDSMASQVATLTAGDSKLNQMARTEGLKAANRRGLLNSSMAVGEAQDALLKNVLPIASQDAATAAAKNAAARAFEYGMAGQVQQQGWQTGERLGAQEFQTGERLGSQAYGTSERLGSQEYGTSERLGTQQFQSGEAAAERGWQTAENIAQRGFLGTQADLDRTLQQTLQSRQIEAADAQQIRQIASTEGIEAANRQLQQVLQERDIQFRMAEGNLDRASAERQQANDIAFRREQGALDRSLQQQIAQWNLSASDRQGATQMVSQNQATYANDVANINANTKLSKSARENALNAARGRFNTAMSLTEQMYHVDLSW